MTYIRQPLKGFPIRYKTIKGKKYAYQRIEAYRDKETGKVHVTDRHLGAVTPARPNPVLDTIDKTDAGIITAAWQRGEDMAWIQTYLKTGAGIKDVPEANTIYKWFRAQGITRGARTTKQAEKRITAAEVKVQRVQMLRAENKAILARQAKRRAQARREIERG